MEIDEVSTTTGAGATLDTDETIALMQAQIDVQNERIRQLVTLTDQLRAQIQELLHWKESVTSRGASPKPNKEHASTENVSLDWGPDRGGSSKSIADLVKETAEQAVASQQGAAGFELDNETGWYFDATSGFFFEPKTKLTYSPHEKKYFEYDEDRGEYNLYPSAAAERILARVSDWHPDPTLRHHRYKPRKASARSSVAEHKLDKKRHRQRSKTQSKKVKEEVAEVEDGELTSSEPSPGSCEDASAGTTPTLDGSDEEGSFKRRGVEPAPCIRAVVVNSAAPGLRKGALFIITCTGGTIGREGVQHAVLVSDPNMSKVHASITYEPDPADADEDDCGSQKNYFVVDCGSKNGTFLNGSQVTDVKCPIVHGSTLKMGDTTLLLHIHPGLQTCGHCEPGLVLEEEPTVCVVEPLLSKEQKDALRRKELKKLRKKFGVDADASAALAKLPVSYTDRAEERRVTKGSDNPFEKTEVASLDEPIQETNRGFKLMKKMGWSTGASLGQSGEDGIKEPIKFEIRSGRTGLGSQAFPSASNTAAVTADANARKRVNRSAEVLATVRRRYEEASVDDKDNGKD